MFPTKRPIYSLTLCTSSSKHYQTYKALPNIFDNYFQYANDIHSYNTRYATNKKFYKPCTRTNIGKQSVSSIVVDLWQDLSTSLKNLNTFTFPGKVKESLLKTQFIVSKIMPTTAYTLAYFFCLSYKCVYLLLLLLFFVVVATISVFTFP